MNSIAEIVKGEIAKRGGFKAATASYSPRLTQVVRGALNGQKIGEYEARYLATTPRTRGASDVYLLDL